MVLLASLGLAGQGREVREGQAFEGSIFPPGSVFLAPRKFLWDKIVSFSFRDYPWPHSIH